MALKIIHEVENLNSPKLKEAMSVLRFSLQDIRTRSSLVQYGIVGLLLSTLNMALSKESPYLPNDLIACLKIISQCDLNSRLLISNHHQLLIKLLTGMRNLMINI
jgi:hypothetical protein